MRRYRWLATITLFSIQELYFVYVVGDTKDENWAHVIYIASSIFNNGHFLSECFSRPTPTICVQLCFHGLHLRRPEPE